METKQEFIDGLRRSLTGKISQEEIEEHVSYYEDYITAETRTKGTEKAVLNALGDPKLIAMSICAADEAEMQNKGEYRANNTGYSNEYVYEGNGDFYGDEYGYASGGMNNERNSSSKDDRLFIFKHPKLTIAIIIIGILVVIVLVVALVFSLLKLLWPVIVVAIIMLLIVRLVAYFDTK